MDDSPVFDYGMPVESPDINTYLAIQMQSLSKISEALGLREQAVGWERRAGEAVTGMLEHFYDPHAGLFWSTLEHEPIPERTLIGLIPLWTGLLGGQVVDRLVAHLTDVEEFWAPYPLSSVAQDAPSFDPEQMWRGPTWANMNYIFIEALEKSGRRHLARRLRRRTIRNISGDRDMHEYINPQTGIAADGAVPMFGWTAAVLIDLLIRETNQRTADDSPTQLRQRKCHDHRGLGGNKHA
jgi:glycogen debranching enzyme